MSAFKDGGPAFPVEIYDNGLGVQTGMNSGWHTGISARDYFAAKALPALIQLFTTGDLTAKDGRPVTEEHFAEQAYCFADAMLAEREKEPSGSIQVAQSKVAETLDYVSGDPDEGRHAVGFAYLVGLIDRAEWERRLEELSPADDDEGVAA